MDRVPSLGNTSEGGALLTEDDGGGGGGSIDVLGADDDSVDTLGAASVGKNTFTLGTDPSVRAGEAARLTCDNTSARLDCDFAGRLWSGLGRGRDLSAGKCSQ